MDDLENKVLRLEAMLMMQMAQSKALEAVLFLVVRRTNVALPEGKGLPEYYSSART